MCKADEMAEHFPELGTEKELAGCTELLASIPRPDFYKQRITCFENGIGREVAHGNVLILGLSENEEDVQTLAKLDPNKQQ